MLNVTLNNGVEMPQLGFGLWQVSDHDARVAVGRALEAGYRSIDTASIYGNEHGAGRAIRESAVPREEVFLTTKLWNADHGHTQTPRAFDRSLELLGTDYVDLYLIHWPAPALDRYLDAWHALEKIYAGGRARAIGVSNFTAPLLRRLLDDTGIVPAVNQIEMHPYLVQTELRALHADHGIVTEAWSPLRQGKILLDDPVLTDIAARHGKSAAQVVVRWHLQIGNVVIPKSLSPIRQRQNIDVFDFTLDHDELDRITALDRNGRVGPDPATMNWLG